MMHGVAWQDVTTHTHSHTHVISTSCWHRSCSWTQWKHADTHFLQHVYWSSLVLNWFSVERSTATGSDITSSSPRSWRRPSPQPFPRSSLRRPPPSASCRALQSDLAKDIWALINYFKIKWHIWKTENIKTVIFIIISCICWLFLFLLICIYAFLILYKI